MNADLHVLGRRIGWERGVPGVELYMDQIVLTAGTTERGKAPALIQIMGKHGECANGLVIVCTTFTYKQFLSHQ